MRLTSPALATAAYATLAAVDTYLAGRPEPAARRARFVTKPLLMPTLLARTRLASSDPAGSLGATAATRSLVRGVETAQVFSWGGDVALLGQGQRSFLAGVGSFLTAHLGYIAGFLAARDPGSALTDPGPKAGVATWAITAPVMAVAAGRQDPTLRVPIAVYAGVLSTMFASSTLVDRSLPQSARRKILAGTSLFLLSDSLLGAQKFLRREASPLLESAVMATYTTGQWLIADGAVTATRA
jgi:uncharacterized membrane protein YhhN